MKNKVVLVTGASKGIGQAIAVVFAEAGYDIIIHYHHDVNGATKTLELCKASGVNAMIISCDLTCYNLVKLMIKECITTFNTLDAVVCNAGILNDKLILMMQERDFDEVINVNLKGTFNVIKHAAKVMAKAKKGSIVSIASVVGSTGNVGQSNYAASKAGLVALTKTAALELSRYNIRCNVISPGLIDTQMSQNLDKSQKQQLLAKTAFKKIGNVNDVAQMALFLVSDEASYITGQQFFVDGGMYAGG